MIWFSAGKLWRAILEFVRRVHFIKSLSVTKNHWWHDRLVERHTGEYLAEVTASCLRRYGLENKVCCPKYISIYCIDLVSVHFKFHTICMDNASNCDSTATSLPAHIPTFRGALSRSRCFPHTVNLIAKARLCTISYHHYLLICD